MISAIILKGSIKDSEWTRQQSHMND